MTINNEPLLLTASFSPVLSVVLRVKLLVSTPIAPSLFKSSLNEVSTPAISSV